MLELFGVLTALALSCGDASGNCLPNTAVAPTVVSEAPATAVAVPKPIIKPAASKATTATKVDKPQKRKIELVLDVPQPKVVTKRRAPIPLLIGNYY